MVKQVGEFHLLNCSLVQIKTPAKLLFPFTMAPGVVDLMAVQPEAPTSITAKSLNGALMSEKSKELIENISSFLDSRYEITEQPIGTRRPIRVVCLGAGYSGLMMSIMFSQKMQGKNAELVVYERNLDLGGTWLENR